MPNSVSKNNSAASNTAEKQAAHLELSKYLDQIYTARTEELEAVYDQGVDLKRKLSLTLEKINKDSNSTNSDRP